MLRALKCKSALAIAALTMPLAVVTHALPTVQENESKVPAYRHGEHVGHPDAPYMARWASIHQESRGQLSYELCNAGVSAFIFEWEGQWGVGQHNAVKPGICPFVSFAAPDGVTLGDAAIKYGPNRGIQNAVAHVRFIRPAPAARAGWLETLIGEGEASHFLSPEGYPEEVVLVKIKVIQEGQGANYEIAWPRPIGPLILQVLRSDPGIAKEIAESMENSLNAGSALVDVFPASALRDHLDTGDLERLPPDRSDGAYLLVTPKVPQGQLRFRLQTGPHAEIREPLTLILDEDKKAVLYYWRHTAAVGVD